MPDGKSKGRMKVCVGSVREIGGDCQWDFYWREPEDLAACVCNCLDWGYQQLKADNWKWFNVSVCYDNPEV